MITKLILNKKNGVETFEERIAPIWFWSSFGLIIAIFSCYVYSRWIFDPIQSLAVPILNNSMSTNQVLRIRIMEATSMCIALSMLWVYLFRALIKKHKVPIEGYILVGTLFGYVFDTTINYFNYVMAWNIYSINLGTWAAFFPGHTGPTRYAEGLLWGPSMYMYFGLLLGLIQYKFIETTKSKIGAIYAFVISFFIAFVFDLVVESFIIRTTQAYAYPHIIPILSVWVGKQYQFPLYASFLVAIYSSIYLCFIYSSKRNKESFVERGVRSLPKQIQFPIRVLAGIGFASLPIVVYFSGMLFFGLFAKTTISLPIYLLPAN
ncbi:spirocyclase AveC family protein [Clostridium sp. WILCCON 0269]|uniref:Spirocyclase AveC family protein n=1 Tax=Candidatus Clostridium eludens TaxID=3381663 RepID=A0ABW8SQF8_9CLOT